MTNETPQPQVPPEPSTKLAEGLKHLGLDLKDPLIRARIDLELKPIVRKYSELLVMAAQALKTKDKDLLEESVHKALEEFKKYNCDFVWDEKLDRKTNPASLDYQNGRWILRLHPIMVVKDVATLKEYMHELGALSLMEQRLRGQQPENLSEEKDKLFLGKGINDLDIGTTHVFDMVLRLMSRD